MKKILAIILVMAMVLVPLTALAVTYDAPAKITFTEKEGKAKTIKVLDEDETAVKNYFVGKDYTLDITPAAGKVVAKIVLGTSTDITADPTFTAVADTKITITYKADPWTIAGSFWDGSTAALAVSGFGSVAVDKPTAKTGTVVLTANLKNAMLIKGGDWGFAVGDDAPAAVGAWATAKGLKLTVDLDAAAEADVFDFTEGVTFYAPIELVGNTITALVNAENPYGKVKVTWLVDNMSAKVEAIANKGAKFIGWDIEGTIWAEAISEDVTSPVIYVNFDSAQDDPVVLEAFFMNISGDFTTATENATGGKSDNPKTGDNSNVALWTIMGIVALGGIALASKKVFAK